MNATMSKILASVLAIAGCALTLRADETPHCIVTEPVGDTTSAACNADTVYGAKDNANQFSIDKSTSQGKKFDLVTFGDSVTENWGTTGIEGSYSKLKIDPNSDGVISMGIGGNRTQNMIYRCENGTLDGYTTKYFTLLAGVNNIYQRIIDSGEDPDKPEDVAEAIRIILNMMLAKHPESKVLLMPILPYAFRYEKNGSYLPNHQKGIRVRENTEEINDIIIRFVDNKRVFWLDLREKFVGADGLPDFAKFGGPGGSYDPDQCLHPNTSFAYSFFNEAVTNAMLKYQGVAAGTAQCTEPSLGLVTYSQSGYDPVATVNLSGIYLGTDSRAVPVTSYSIAYELDGGAKTTVLSNQTLTRNSFTIPNVALGEHTVRVSVTTADNKVVTRDLTFTKCDGWVAEALPADDSAVRTDGTLAYAYSSGSRTSNGVTFTSVNGNKIETENMVFAPGTQAGSCWWANAGAREVTLKRLTPGHNYLVQIISYRNEVNTTGNIWIDEAFHESYANKFFIRANSGEWTHGGSLSGVFTADTSTTKTFTMVSDGNWAVNAIQVRDLGDSGSIPVAKVNPSIASVTAVTNGAAATVSLTGVVMGTDDEGVSATSYAVSYSLNGAASVAALANQTGESASFTITDLADAKYTCAVTITTDAGKTVSKSVNFTIDAIPDPVDPSIGSLQAKVSGSNVTFTVSSVVMGTDSACNPATSYAVSYSLTNAASVVVLEGQTASTASFTLTDLEPGTYSCTVTITTDKNLVATKSASFKISSSGSGGTIVESGWTAGPMSADGSTVRTDGTLVYAYSTLGATVNGVSFARDPYLKGNEILSDPLPDGFTGDLMNEDVSDSAYGLMLGNGWYWSKTSETADVTLTLSGLEVGKSYLVQLIAHNRWTSSMRISANGSTPQPVGTNGADADYRYGASIVGMFTAEATTKVVSISYTGASGFHPLNAIQVREVDAGEVPVQPEDPVVPVYSLTIPAAANMMLASVTTNGVALSATAGAYSVVSNTAVKVTFTAAAGYEFEGSDYVTVTVTADTTLATFPVVKAKVVPADPSDPSEPSSPSVLLGWTAEPLEADASTVKTNGTLKYAYRAKFDWDSSAKSSINTVDFQKVNDLSTVTDFSVSKTMSFADYLGEESGGSYGSLMPQGFRNGSSGDCVFTLNGLEKGKSYLVQLLMHWSGKSTFTACPSGDTDKTVQFGGAGWTYGGSLTGVFTATGSSQDITISYSDNAIFNAIQVREVEVAEEEEEVTVSPGQTVTVDSEDAANAVVVKIADDAAKNAGQASLVKRVIKQNAAGKYEVTVEIDEDKIIPLNTTVAAFASVGLANIAKGEGAVTVTVSGDKVTSGLYYSIEYADDLAFDQKGATVSALATSAGLSVAVPKLTSAKQFFRVVASLVGE